MHASDMLKSLGGLRMSGSTAKVSVTWLGNVGGCKKCNVLKEFPNMVLGKGVLGGGGALINHEDGKSKTLSHSQVTATRTSCAAITAVYSSVAYKYHVQERCRMKFYP
eukprot:7695641-Pyramimonas_sp.AAC.1